MQLNGHRDLARQKIKSIPVTSFVVNSLSFRFCDFSNYVCFKMLIQTMYDTEAVDILEEQFCHFPEHQICASVVIAGGVEGTSMQVRHKKDVTEIYRNCKSLSCGSLGLIDFCLIGSRREV